MSADSWFHFQWKLPLVAAHRGGSPADIDNSLAAFEHALSIGAHLMECDLRRSADGIIVLYHDDNIHGDRVNDLPLAELRRRIPTLLTLDELLDRLDSHEAESRLVLDLKERDIDRPLADLLQRRGLTSRTLITSQNAFGLRRLALRFPDLRIGLSRGQLADGIKPVQLRRPYALLVRPILFFWLLPQLRWARAGTLALNWRLLSAGNSRQFTRAGLRLYIWTVDDCERAVQMTQLGADMLATNIPQELLEYLGWERPEDR